MYFLYLDESGSNTSHFVLFGLGIPALSWQKMTNQITPIKKAHELEGKEIHTGWMMRRFLEQEKIPNFENLNYEDRKKAVIEKRKIVLNKLAMLGEKKKIQRTKKAFSKTIDYIHLTFAERKKCLQALADLIGTWTDSRLFAEATNRELFNLEMSVYENSFSNVISRFDTFLENYGKRSNQELYGIVIQDQNESQSLRLI
jgi:hypothetical protein